MGEPDSSALRFGESLPFLTLVLPSILGHLPSAQITAVLRAFPLQRPMGLEAPGGGRGAPRTDAFCGGSPDLQLAQRRLCVEPVRSPVRSRPGPVPLPALFPGASCGTVSPSVMCLSGLVVPPHRARLMPQPGSFQRLGNKPCLSVPAEIVCAVFAKGLQETAAAANKSQPEPCLHLLWASNFPRGETESQ